MKKTLRCAVSLVTALVLVFSPISGAIPTVAEANGTQTVSAEVVCDVRFSRPAICCDVSDVIDLTRCGVQFSADSGMMNSGIVWTYNGSTIRSFVPSERGVYALTATAGNDSKVIYVVAKSPEETEYVLYRNDFHTAPTDFRVLEQSNGASISVSDSNYIMDASGHTSAYVRVLLPEFLDVFGDVTIKANMKIAKAYNDTKWASLMYRVQNGDYPYYQGLLRSGTTAANGAEISQKNAANVWEVYEKTGFEYTNASAYNLYTVRAEGTHSVFSVNGRQVLEYGNTGFAAGAMGIQTRGAKVMVDYVEVTLSGNDTAVTTCDVSYAKPAIRADMGDTIDLTGCDVQFTVNAVYTKGSSITWKKDGVIITSFTPTQAGVTLLTATSGTSVKNVYVVTRDLTDGEYVLYENDFSTAPTDFRLIQQTNASAYHDGAGHYIIDASASKDSYVRVLLPTFLDEFGDFKLITSYLESNAVDTTKWSSLMGRVQNSDYPYIQFCIRHDANVANGVEITRKAEAAQTVWDVKRQGASAAKVAGAYNTYAVTMQNSYTYGYINGERVISYGGQTHPTGAMGLQARGMKLTVDDVKVTLGETTAQQDTAVACAVSKSRPAIGCNAGQTILLDRCAVQFTYGAYPVPGDQITWTKDGQVITEFSDTSLGQHKLTATHGHTSMDVYVVAKKCTTGEHVLYSNDFTTGPTDYRVPEASNGGKVYPIDGTFVLNGSASADAYVRVLMPVFLDQFGDANFEASIKLTAPTDTSKWGAVLYRAQNAQTPYVQCCYRYDSTSDSGVEITERTADGTWNVIQSGSTTVHSSGGYNVINITTSDLDTTFSINKTQVLSTTDTPYYNGSWGFQVRGLTMTIDYVRMFFYSNHTTGTLYTIPGGYVDVRDPSTGISIAPALITDVKTKAQFDDILTGCPAIAIMNYDVIDGIGKIVFSDGVVMPDEALDKLGSKVIPAFRIDDETDADSLAAFLQGRGQRDAYAVSSDLSLLNRAYSRWKYIRGVADYSSLVSFDPETVRCNALANTARVLILPENASKEAITKIQDSNSCVWLTISEGKTASVAATNKGPYGLITPDRAVTEFCYQNYYGSNTMIRRPNVIGHRGNPSVAPENTILGTQTAYSNGATLVENDIYLTADDVVIVMHDETIDRTTNGSGKVLEMTSAQLAQYKVDYFSGVAAQPIPTLEDYFKSIKDKAGQKLVIEMKHPADPSLAKGMAEMIRKYDIMDQVVVISFIYTNLQYASNELPGVPVGWLTWLELDDAAPIRSVYEALESVQDYRSVCNPGYSGWGATSIREMAYRGVTLWPWTINKQDQFDQLMIDGVGGITTDYSQWSKDYIESIHWNSASRVISSTYQHVLTDITNSCEVVVIEDTLGISTSAGNITVPEKKEGGKASFYYRYKRTTSSGQSYYTVTEIRTIEVASQYKLELIAGSEYALGASYLTKLDDRQTVAQVKAQFKYPVTILDHSGNAMEDTAIVSTGHTICLTADMSLRVSAVVKGDVNGDGAIDSTDYLNIKSHFLERTRLTGASLKAADCDEDDIITATDYLQLKSYFLGTYDLFS